ncbi:MAG: hypothetical protein ACFCVK_21340 [Acidimicrobiales bacterium]
MSKPSSEQRAEQEIPPAETRSDDDRRTGDEGLPDEVTGSGHHRAAQDATVVGPSGERNPEPDEVDEEGSTTEHHLATADTLERSPERVGRDPATETAIEAPDRDRQE